MLAFWMWCNPSKIELMPCSNERMPNIPKSREATRNDQKNCPCYIQMDDAPSLPLHSSWVRLLKQYLIESIGCRVVPFCPHGGAASKDNGDELGYGYTKIAKQHSIDCVLRTACHNQKWLWLQHNWEGNWGRKRRVAQQPKGIPSQLWGN